GRGPGRSVGLLARRAAAGRRVVAAGLRHGSPLQTDPGRIPQRGGGDRDREPAAQAGGFSVAGDGMFRSAWRFVTGVADGRPDPAALIIGIGALVLILVLRRVAPRV